MKRLLPFVALLSAVLIWGQEPLTNDSVVKMVKAGLTEEVILSMVRSQPARYVLTADELVALKAAGVPDKVVAAMVERNSGGGTPGSTATASGAPSPLRLEFVFARIASMIRLAVGQGVSESVVREIRAPRSMKGVWKRSYGRAEGTARRKGRRQTCTASRHRATFPLYPRADMMRSTLGLDDPHIRCRQVNRPRARSVGSTSWAAYTRCPPGVEELRFRPVSCRDMGSAAADARCN